MTRRGHTFLFLRDEFCLWLQTGEALGECIGHEHSRVVQVTPEEQTVCAHGSLVLSAEKTQPVCQITNFYTMGKRSTVLRDGKGMQELLKPLSQSRCPSVCAFSKPPCCAGEMRSDHSMQHLHSPCILCWQHAFHIGRSSAVQAPG